MMRDTLKSMLGVHHAADAYGHCALVRVKLDRVVSAAGAQSMIDPNALVAQHLSEGA